MLEENGADGLLPGEIDQLLVRLDRIGDGRNSSQEQAEKDKCLDRENTTWCRDRVLHCGSWAPHTVQGGVNRRKGVVWL